MLLSHMHITHLPIKVILCKKYTETDPSKCKSRLLGETANEGNADGCQAEACTVTKKVTPLFCPVLR